MAHVDRSSLMSYSTKLVAIKGIGSHRIRKGNAVNAQLLSQILIRDVKVGSLLMDI